jgi:hypothetical protein
MIERRSFGDNVEVKLAIVKVVSFINDIFIEVVFKDNGGKIVV